MVSLVSPPSVSLHFVLYGLPVPPSEPELSLPRSQTRCCWWYVLLPYSVVFLTLASIGLLIHLVRLGYYQDVFVPMIIILLAVLVTAPVGLMSSNVLVLRRLGVRVWQRHDKSVQFIAMSACLQLILALVGMPLVLSLFVNARVRYQHEKMESVPFPNTFSDVYILWFS